jgi:large subunit ribosomal protein L24
MKIKKGDSVVIVTGDQKGPTVRKVVSVVDGGRKLVIEKVNVAFKHVRRGHPKSPQGGRLQVERPIDASNVKLHCGACNAAVRVGYRFTDEGAKERYCKKCGASAGTISPAKARYAKS